MQLETAKIRLEETLKALNNQLNELAAAKFQLEENYDALQVLVAGNLDNPYFNQQASSQKSEKLLEDKAVLEAQKLGCEQDIEEVQTKLKNLNVISDGFNNGTLELSTRLNTESLKALREAYHNGQLSLILDDILAEMAKVNVLNVNNSHTPF